MLVDDFPLAVGLSLEDVGEAGADGRAGGAGFDREALDSRKESKPQGSVIDTTAAMGIELLSEAQYRELQKLGDFDRKTSSWVATPPDIRLAFHFA